MDFFEAPKPREYQLTELKERHHEILRLHLLGLNNVDIAEQLDMTPEAVSYTIHSELGKDKLLELRSARDIDAVDASSVLKECSVKAAQNIADIVNGDRVVKDDLFVKANLETLDRVGVAKITKVQGRFEGVLGDMGIQMIKERARALGLSSGDIVDANYTEVVNG